MNDNIIMLLAKLKKYSLMTYNHSIAVSNMCVSFGRMIGLNECEIEKLRIAGLLHDIGKLNIPLSILHKSSNLTLEEYNILKKHPLYGVNLLIKVGFKDEDILNLILCHHEKLNGLGYPNGLKENSIPLLARILTICDCYDAMSSKRTYKEAKDIDYIKKEFIKNSGEQFDNYYVNLFLPYLDITMANDNLKLASYSITNYM